MICHKSIELWAFPFHIHIKSDMLEYTEMKCLDSWIFRIQIYGGVMEIMTIFL